MRWQQAGLALWLVLGLAGVSLAAKAQASVAAAEAEGPLEIVRSTADQVLAEVTANKVKLDADPSGIYSLVESTVVPRFDFTTMSQSAMGRYWRSATPEQREQITSEFRELLVRTYAVALLGYSGQQIQYLPVRLRDGETDVMVPTRIDPGTGGPAVPINYRMHRLDGAWLVYDVVIDGVSLVTNYRSTFASTVRQRGVDGLIRQLADRNQQLRG
jgi:phospholipid transport system substrate-binding protein